MFKGSMLFLYVLSYTEWLHLRKQFQCLQPLSQSQSCFPLILKAYFISNTEVFNCYSTLSSFLRCHYAYINKYVCTFFRGRQAMWLKAVTMPETGPGLLSSHMSMKKNSRVLRHMHVSSEMCFF